MRFFGSAKKRNQQGLHEQDSSGEAEARTDESATPQRNGNTVQQGRLKSPALQSEKGITSAPLIGRLPQSEKEQADKSRGALSAKPKGVSPKKGVASNHPAAKAPLSILHKNTQYSAAPTTTQLPPPPPSPPTNDYSPMPVYQNAGNNNPRVRFMSSGESVASTEASQVHLMAGANSVASSSCMSSSADNHTNVFDRVLNMVMAEEHERLNATGMSMTPHGRLSALGMSRADSKSNNVARLKNKHKQTGSGADRFSKADAKAKAAVAALGGSHSSSSDDDLGLLPPSRCDLAPIDIDTGLEIRGSHEAPIDADTGLKVIYETWSKNHKGIEITNENEYHDTNDDQMEEKRFKQLNEDAIRRMKDVQVSDSRQCNSYDCSLDQQPSFDKYHVPRSPSHGADLENSARNQASSGKGSGKKTKKKFWERNKDIESDEWVAFDNQGSRSTETAAQQRGRVSDLAEF